MFGSGVLDTVIGLVFVFLLVSMLVTIANELIASLVRSRAKWLQFGIARLLGSAWAEQLYAHPLVQGTAMSSPDRVSSSTRPWLGSGPSYIPSRTFANVLVDLLGQGNPAETRLSLRELVDRVPEARVRDTLRVLLDDAHDDVETFKQNIEIWFNNAMDRVGGWYKRRSQAVVAGLSLVAAIVLNVDALAVLRHLDTHAGVRDALVAQAKAMADKPSAAAASASAPLSSQFDDVQKRLRQLSLPIGWTSRLQEGAQDDDRRVIPRTQDKILDTLAYHLLGWLLTGLAGTLGAPFWFDTLNRLIAIRSAGKAPEEAPKPPKEVPTPLEPGQSPREADALKAGLHPPPSTVGRTG